MSTTYRLANIAAGRAHVVAAADPRNLLGTITRAIGDRANPLYDGTPKHPATLVYTRWQARITPGDRAIAAEFSTRAAAAEWLADLRSGEPT